MIFYALVVVAVVAATVGYAQTDTHVMWVVLGLATLMHVLRNTKMRMNAPYAAVILCILCLVTVAFGIVWYAAGHWIATAAAVVALAPLGLSGFRVIPTGIRIMRTVFSV